MHLIEHARGVMIRWMPRTSRDITPPHGRGEPDLPGLRRAFGLALAASLRGAGFIIETHGDEWPRHRTSDAPGGCCGAPGDGPPNRACRCGAAVGSEMSDCSTPYELHLLPAAVRLAADAAAMNSGS
ncbi:hypothetical protein ACFWBC_36775 [Streptomyces sp. NPDC059985]|uniref:hypothetical protein n=1 Tax=Streptomyces sp. NPDC059985 TaxID=3347025 RepID=UPI0036CB60F0